MTQLILVQVLALWMLVNVNNVPSVAQITIPPVSTAGESNGVCPSESMREDLMSILRQKIRMQLQNYTQNQEQTEDGCGGARWTRVLLLNMTDSSQTCPSGWVQATFNGLRLCGRPPNADFRTCTQTTFSTGGMEYRQVCGRALGYQYGDTVAFGAFTVFTPDSTIDDYYLDGLTLTHGPSGLRQHIWSFVNGYSENRNGRDACPCAPLASGYTIPSIIGSDYFCESGSADGSNILSFHEELLWDGTGCSLPGNTCCTFSSPPYFSIQLPSATTNDIDGRLCGYENGNTKADTYITFLELYIK